MASSSFVYPHAPSDGLVWWRRPCYFSTSGYLGTEAYRFRWTCAFCRRDEDGCGHYGKVGYRCPKCGAVFIGDDSFGTWMAMEVDREWAEGREEIWG